MIKNKGTVAGFLACMAMTGFLSIFVVLSFAKVPTENREFFNTGFIALISFVTTAFGYYLGSSVGSARKTDLLNPSAPTTVSDLINQAAIDAVKK